MNTKGVLSADVTYINGGILVYYKKGFRESILSKIAGLKKQEIPIVNDDNSNAIRELDNNFKQAIVKSFAKNFLIKTFLPAPIRFLITLKRAKGYVASGLSSLGDGKLDVAVLDAVSISASILSGSYSTANSIMFLLGITGLLEDYTHKKAKASLAEGLFVNVDKVWLVTDGEDVSIPLSQIQTGDKIRVRAGSMIPVDGNVTDGEALINEASMTGEPLPVMKNTGSSVFAGTVIEEGSIVLEVRELPDNSRIQRIVSMIDESEALKAGIQNRAEKLADAIVPYSLITAIGTFAFTRSISKALSVLMVDYSCAIKLSSPICVISAMREATNYSIMVKGGKHLESYAQADTIIFDKTGTLTNTCPKLTKVIAFNGYDRATVLKISACIEEHFPHSIARAVVHQAEIEGLNHEEEHADVEYIVAHGIATQLNGERTLIGSSHFLFEDEKIKIDDDIKEIIKQEEKGCSVLYLSIGGKLVGMLCITDPIREEAVDVIKELKRNGFKRIIMLTGDSESAAKAACEQLGITEYRAQVLPEDKANVVSSLKQEGHKVVMVGDGINDSPALAVADVSVSMKSASDIAREVADISLLSEDLMSLITLRKLSMGLFERIRYNHGFIVTFNTMLIIGGICGTLTPATSALLHNVSTTAISGLSMRPFLNR
jgi:heavy metal translocating P-type ATPase